MNSAILVIVLFGTGDFPCQQFSLCGKLKAISGACKEILCETSELR